MTCLVCDTNWVCEAHPDKPSDITSDREDACHCGGAAMPCRACGGDFGLGVPAGQDRERAPCC
jgi:hypothetical protein